MNRTGHLVRSGSPKPETVSVKLTRLPPQGGGATKTKTRASNPNQLFPGKPKKVVESDTWWIGLSRQQLNAEATRRHPGTDTGRPSMPTAHARGALKGR